MEDMLIEVEEMKERAGFDCEHLALSCCRRMLVFHEYGSKYLSVLYLDEGESDNNSKKEREEEREEGEKEEERNAPSSPTLPFANSSIAYRTLLDEVLPSYCVSACFSPCQRLLAVWCEEGILHVWYVVHSQSPQRGEVGQSGKEESSRVEWAWRPSPSLFSLCAC